MGIGDDIIATGMARGAAERGVRIAFGDGQRIIWGPHSSMVFRGNPNVAHPGSEHARNVEWVRYHKGHRIYNKQGDGRWIWNYGFRVRPGEFFLTTDERGLAIPDLVMIEPNTPNKPNSPNKQWPLVRWCELAERLTAMGFIVRQFSYGRPNKATHGIETKTFRHAVGLLRRSRLAVLPEGGLHHAAAAVGVPAVVLFGGFAPPAVLGYDVHINLTGGAEACGSFTRCQHCIDAMSEITVDRVMESVKELINASEARD